MHPDVASSTMDMSGTPGSHHYAIPRPRMAASTEGTFEPNSPWHATTPHLSISDVGDLGGLALCASIPGS